MAVGYLVRHGQASFGTADYDVLSDVGHKQAELVGAELTRRGVRPARAVCGTLRRQRETAEGCLNSLIAHNSLIGEGEALVVDRRWDEYDPVDLLAHHAPVESGTAATGVFTGAPHPPGEPPQPGAVIETATRAEASRLMQQVLDSALADWVRAGETSPAARTWPAFRDGALAAAEELLAAAGRGGTGVAFTSGGVIAAICAGLLGLDADGFVAMNRVIANGSITKVVSGRGGTNLISFNDHAHLEIAGRDLLTYR